MQPPLRHVLPLGTHTTHSRPAKPPVVRTFADALSTACMTCCLLSRLSQLRITSNTVCSISTDNSKLTNIHTRPYGEDIETHPYAAASA